MSECSAGGDKGMRWQDFAACQGADPDLFFLHDDERYAAARGRLKRGKRICQRCPVQNRCREEALKADDRYALMGGMTAAERDKMKRNGVPQDPAPIPDQDESVIEALVGGASIPGASRVDIAHACVRIHRLGGVSYGALGRRFGFTPGIVRNWVTRAERGKPPISPAWWVRHGDPALAEVS